MKRNEKKNHFRRNVRTFYKSGVKNTLHGRKVKNCFWKFFENDFVHQLSNIKKKTDRKKFRTIYKPGVNKTLHGRKVKIFFRNSSKMIFFTNYRNLAKWKKINRKSFRNIYKPGAPFNVHRENKIKLNISWTLILRGICLTRGW